MPKIVDHEARRVDILDRSLGLFADRGYTGLSMRDLATGLGVSTGTVYHYFPNKAALFESMMRHLGRTNVTQAIADLQPGSTLMERKTIFRAFIETRAEQLRHSLWVAIDYQRAVDEDASNLVREIMTGYQDALTELLADGDQQLGRLMLYMLLGLLVHDGLQPEDVDIGEEVFRMTERITALDPGV